MTKKWMAGPQVAHVSVDHQNDFCEGGHLAVAGGAGIVALVNDIQTHFQVNVKTQDFHPAGHQSFASSHAGRAEYELIDAPYGLQRLWPDHCIAGTPGADFHPSLVVGKNDLIIRKGTNPDVDSYSAFFENDRVTRPHFADGESFADKMRSMGITTLVFTGLAFDYCVGWTALDAVKEGFDAIVVEDATRAIAPDSAVAMRAQLLAAGVQVVNAVDLPNALGVAGPAKAPKGFTP